jgi:hypothetical protein
MSDVSGIIMSPKNNNIKDYMVYIAFATFVFYLILSKNSKIVYG